MDQHDTASPQPRSDTDVDRLDIQIAGMTCAHCAGRITQALQEVDGVRQANVNPTTGVASVVYEPSQVGPTDLLALIRKAGYLPGSARVRLAVKGMTCASCVSAVEQALRATPGVVMAEVNPASAQADVEYLPQTITFQGLQEAVADSGYEAVAPPLASEEGMSREESERHQEYRRLMRKFWFAAIVSIPVMAFSYPDLFPGLREWMPMGSLERRMVWSFLGMLTLPVMLWAGSQFYTGMWSALKHRSANMHTLIALGISAAFLYSIVAVTFPQWFPEQALAEVFWDVTAVVVALVVLGMALEAHKVGDLVRVAVQRDEERLFVPLTLEAVQ